MWRALPNMWSVLIMLHKQEKFWRERKKILVPTLVQNSFYLCRSLEMLRIQGIFHGDPATFLSLLAEHLISKWYHPPSWLCWNNEASVAQTKHKHVPITGALKRRLLSQIFILMWLCPWILLKVMVFLGNNSCVWQKAQNGDAKPTAESSLKIELENPEPSPFS